jgi:hypothetical protein
MTVAGRGGTADATDLKSISPPSKTPENQAFRESTDPSLRKACADLASNPTLLRLILSASTLTAKQQAQLATLADSMSQ